MNYIFTLFYHFYLYLIPGHYNMEVGADCEWAGLQMNHNLDGRNWESFCCSPLFYTILICSFAHFICNSCVLFMYVMWLHDYVGSVFYCAHSGEKLFRSLVCCTAWAAMGTDEIKNYFSF